MIQLTKGLTQNIILTLTEKATTASPIFLFVFTNRSSNEEIKFIKLNNQDISLYQERYDKFTIVVDDYFSNSLAGQYTYNVYQNSSTTNLNPNGLVLLENGIMELIDSPSIEYKQHTTNDIYKIRQ